MVIQFSHKKKGLKLINPVIINNNKLPDYQRMIDSNRNYGQVDTSFTF